MPDKGTRLVGLALPFKAVQSTEPVMTIDWAD